jgi:hypothetical protein
MPRFPVPAGPAVLAALALVLAGCASVTSGTGTIRTSGASSRPPVSASTPVGPTSLPPTSSASVAPRCAPADYCDDFADASSGWPVENETNYFANYDPYLGGTYRMGERTTNGKTQLAPLDITTISSDYSVQVDVDAVLGKSAPTSSYMGIVCWDHHAADGSEAGFLFFVSANSVDVTLLPDSGSGPQTLNENQGGSFVKPYPAKNHLTATCLQRTAAGGVEADLTLAIDGATVLHEQYAKSVKNYTWSPGPKVGLLVGGEKSDVFYDNFAVTGQ